MRQSKIIPGVDPKLLIKDAAKLMPDPARRGFLRGAASLGALAFLTGCDIIDGDTAEGILRKISSFNDGAQAALFFFALGLLAKPMTVTEPFVLLLLDYWPLGRWPARPAPTAGKRKGRAFSALEARRTAFRLVWEKAPLFALAAVSCLITYIVQQGAGAMVTVTALPLWTRLGNALLSYVDYLIYLVWPLNLAVFYPYAANSLAWWKITGAALFLGGITALAIREARRFPYFPVGWFWYLGTLVPVIGLVQVGVQAMADRYTYIPLIGIFIILAFGAADLAVGRRRRQMALAGSFGLALLACLILTCRQVGYWRDSVTIYSRALDVTENNYIAYNNLGMTYFAAGRHDEAMAMFQQSIRCNPKFADAYNNIGLELSGRGDFSAAISMFQQAIDLQPNIKKARSNMGWAYLKQGRAEEAWKMFETALKKDPANADPNNLASACNILAIYLAEQGERAFAIRFFQEAIRLQPNYDKAYYNLGLAYLKQDMIREAREMFETALKKNPNSAGAREMLDSLQSR